MVAVTLTFKISKRNLTEIIKGPTLMTSEKMKPIGPAVCL
jgi:hypothetical protein